MIKQRGAYIRAITEITQDNLNYCKILKGMVDELRHLKGIKGGIAVSEDQYMTATSSLLQTDIASTEKIKIPMSEAVYSKRSEVVRHNQYIFDTLWENATAACKRFRELEINNKSN
jgi:hypothetical protein